jgi:hypothetical protein
VLHQETQGEAIITTGVGQHQMFAAQWYPLPEPRRWVTSGGLGSMGFGLPSALGAAAAHDGKNGRPSRVVVDVDGDGSFLMNCQELATAAIEKLNIKVLLLNNQHLGMVVQWEDRFYKVRSGSSSSSRVGRDGVVWEMHCVWLLVRMLLNRGCVGSWRGRVDCGVSVKGLATGSCLWALLLLPNLAVAHGSCCSFTCVSCRNSSMMQASCLSSLHAAVCLLSSAVM